jgi:DHA1 family multidrug resistance protein-like MFS transporter
MGQPMSLPFGRRAAPILLAPWQRNLYTIVLAETAAMIGFSIAQPFLPFYLQDLGVTSIDEVARWVGVINSFQPLCMALSAPLWGMAADRVGRKPMLARAMIGGGIALVLSGLAGNAPQLAVFRIMEGILAGTVAAATTLVAVSTPREQTGYGLGLLTTGMFTGNFVGPLLGGFVASTLGYRVAFLMAGVVLCVSGLLVLIVVRENFVRPAPRKHKGNPFASTLRDVIRNPVVLAMILLLSLNNLSVGVTMPVLPLYVQSITSDVKQAAAATGVIVGATALANALAAIWLGRSADRLGRRRVLIGCILLGALSYLPQGLTRAPWQLLGLRVLTGFSMGGISPVTNAIIAEATPEGKHGGVYGVSASLQSAGRALGPIIGTVVVTTWSVAATFPVTGVLLLAAAILLTLRTARTEETTRMDAGRESGR